MNIDIELLNRAFEKAGEEALNDNDIQNESTRFKTAKSYYLPTILETLSNTEWTCQKTRAKLVYCEDDNLTDYAYMYYLPVDCAKPERINNDDEFIVEADILYTNTADAILMYISNGKIEKEEDYLEEDDYPEYRQLKFSPLLSEYIETRIAAKIAFKITGKSELYQLLYSDSLMMEKRASAASFTHGKSRENGEPWWGDQLGLTGDGIHVNH